LFPVLCGSSLHNKGVQPVLDAVVDYLPSPLDLPAAESTEPRTQKTVACPSDPQAPLAALAFKIARDPFAGHLVYLRLYSGHLRAGQTVWNATRGQRERIGHLLRMHADRREELAAAEAGDIVAVPGLKGVATGDSLCEQAHQRLLESISFPDPVVQMAVEPMTQAEQTALSEALAELAAEDPTFRVAGDADTGQTVIAGMGELHLEVLLQRIRDEHGLQVRVGRPRVSYQETIGRAVADVEGNYIRDLNGHRVFAQVVLELAPGERGSGVAFANGVSASRVPKAYIEAVKHGALDALRSGVLLGQNVTDLTVRLTDGAYHETDSSDEAFQAAAALAVREGLERAGPVLLEPVCALEVSVPHDYMGDVLGQLAARHCEITGTESVPGGGEQIRALVPLAEMFGYATELRSASQGRGTFSLEFAHYAPVDPARSKALYGRG